MKFKQIILAIIAAFFGVQTQKNRKKDFQSQSPLPYIICGVVITIILVIMLLSLVSFVLR